jgi:hypothetical protein
MQEVKATTAKHWTELVWYCHNQRWMRSLKEGTETARSGSFKNGQEWGKKCFEDLDQQRMGRPATRTWSADFLLWEGSSLEEIGKWLTNKSIPRRQRRRLLLVVTGTFPCGDSRCKSIGTEERLRACWVRSRMRSVEAAGNESCRRRQLATFRAQAVFDKRRLSPPHTMSAPGSCY